MVIVLSLKVFVARSLFYINKLITTNQSFTRSPRIQHPYKAFKKKITNKKMFTK